MGASRYKKQYCKDIVKWLSEGKTLASFAKSVGVSAQRIYDWEKSHPEFKEALAVARTAHLAFFEHLALAHITGSIKKDRNEALKHLRFSDPSMLKWFMSKRFKEFQDSTRHDIVSDGETIVYRSFIDATGQVRSEKDSN